MTTGYPQPLPSPQGQPWTRQQDQGQGRAARGSRSGASRRSSEALVDFAESELADGFELPGADMSAEEHAVEILAEQLDEFTCGSCFLVRHRSQLAREKGGLKFCRDCEG